jgi:hypothetical protein
LFPLPVVNTPIRFLPSFFPNKRFISLQWKIWLRISMVDFI